MWPWRNLLTTQWDTWNQWYKTALLLREKRKNSNKIQRPIKETYKNRNDRAIEVSVRPLNLICLTRTKVHCSIGSKHHKTLTGKGCCWRKDICSFWSISVYSVTDRAIFIGISKAKTISIPFFSFLVGGTILNANPGRSKRFYSVHSIRTGSGAHPKWNPGRCLLVLNRWSMKLIISVRLWVQDGAEIYLHCRICLYDTMLNLARGSL